MRQLYNKDSGSKSLEAKGSSFTLSEDDYTSIIEHITELTERTEGTNTSLQDYKDALSRALETYYLKAYQLNVDYANIDNIVSEAIETGRLEVGNITVTALSNIVEAVINTLAVSGNATVGGNLTVNGSTQLGDTTASTLTASTITADTANITNYDIDNGSIDNLRSETIIGNTATINTGNIDVIHSQVVNAEQLDSNLVTARGSLIDQLYTDKMDARFILHNLQYNRMYVGDDSVAADGDYWIVLPKFVNGSYNIIGTTNTDSDKGEVLWSLEINNSSNNIMFRWSSPYKMIRDIDIVSDTDNKCIIQVHCNTQGKATYVWYQAISFDTDEAPSIYATKQYEGKVVEINAEDGTWIPNSMFAGEFHADSIVIDNTEFETVIINTNIKLPVSKDSYGNPVSYSTGDVGDYITNSTDSNGNTWAKWTTPADKVERNNEKLITSDAVSDYTGRIDNPDYDGDNEQYLYPLTNLGNNTLVHGNEIVEDSLTVQEDIRNDMLFSGTPLTSDIAALTDGAIVIDSATNQAYVKVTQDDEAVLYPLTANDGNLSNNKPVVWDSEHGYLKSADDLSIDSLSVDVLNANTAYIKKLSTVEEETLLSTGDYTVLRANNPSPLSSTDYSGLLIHNYNGESNDLALVADSDGTLRVGTGTPTDVTYANLYFSNNKWYSDETLETEVTPAGSLTSWDSVETTDDYKHYTNAVFSVITYDTLQPLLTRDEEENLTDQGLLKYNTSSHKADTISVPTNTSTLVYQEGKTDTCWVGYGWSFRPANGCAWNYYTCTTDITSCVEAGCYDMHQGLCDSQSIDILYNQNGCSRGFTHTSCMCILIPRQNFCSIYISDGEKHLEFHPTELYCWHHVNVTTCASLPGTLVNVYTGRVDDWGCIAHYGWSCDYCTQEAGYKWCAIQPGVYCYASMACYKAADTSDIPEGSIVIIGDEHNYLKGDDK